MPTTVEAEAARSTQLPRRRAASTPVPTPSTVHSTAAPSAMEAVTGNRSAISEVTGSFSRNENPKHAAEELAELHQHRLVVAQEVPHRLSPLARAGLPAGRLGDVAGQQVEHEEG